MTGKRKRRAGFGNVEKLPSGRYRARYSVPGSARPQRWVYAPMTFDRKGDAEVWLARERTKIADGLVRPQVAQSRVTLAEYAAEWLDTRTNPRGEPLRPSTRRVYEHYLERHILPAFGGLPMSKITERAVTDWYRDLLPGRPTLRARVYALLKGILGTALQDNPCKIRGGSQARPATRVQVATPEQVAALAEAMPDRLRLAVLLGAWAQLRSGEVLELRRRDITPEAVTVTRALTWVKGAPVVGEPKTEAGVRTVALPPHIADVVTAHLAEHTGPGADALLFPAKPGGRDHLHSSTFATAVKAAVRQTDLPDGFRFHHLRHTGLTLAAQSGATVAELMSRAGHTTPGIAGRYQHAVSTRDKAVAAALSAMASGGSAPG